jgi:hypothetical protein
MKAKPLILGNDGFVQVSAGVATHVEINIPGPAGSCVLPIILKGSREGTGCWTWNGDTERPTLKPSVLRTSGHYVPGFKEGDSCWCTYYAERPDEVEHFKCFRCHTWINDGKAQFLPDCSHELAGQTLDLLEVD